MIEQHIFTYVAFESRANVSFHLFAYRKGRLKSTKKLINIVCFPPPPTHTHTVTHEQQLTYGCEQYLSIELIKLNSQNVIKATCVNQ